MPDWFPVLVSFTRNDGVLVIRWLAVLCGTFVLAMSPTPGQQSFVTIKGDLTSTAWWVLAEFHPVTTEVRGIPAGQIRKGWCKATEFRKDLIPRELLFDGQTDVMASAGLSFAVEGQFDHSAANQVALVGVYQECSGQKGRFILILDQSASGKAKIRFVNAAPSDHQFGALEKGESDTIVAWTCMECDGRSILKWDSKRRRFGWLPARSED